MALIKCPECGKEISDKATVCVGCGFPIQEYIKEENSKPKEIPCPYCSELTPSDSDYCGACGMRLTPYLGKVKNAPSDNKQSPIKLGRVKDCHVGSKTKSFNGVYRYTLLGEKQEVYCPRCGSSNCSHYQEQKVIPGKTKTRYTVNLNPLRPFTLLNKKEKVVKKEKLQTENKFICNSCGKIFY